MKLLFQIIFWIGIGSMSIGFLSFSTIQIRKYHQRGYLESLTSDLTPSEVKVAKIGGIFLLIGFLFLAIAAIYHFQFGFN